MSKRNVNDKSTYTFMKMGVQYFSHGKITLDNKSSYTEGKEIECPNCSHEFLWDKFYNLSPRYPKSWYKDRGLPYGFKVEMEINTPSIDCKGDGDPLPRISYIIYGCKLKIEDRVNDSSPKDGVSFRSDNKQLTMEILEMNDGGDKYSNCCEAPFGYPGWPDCDLCSACGEHAEPSEELEYANNR